MLQKKLTENVKPIFIHKTFSSNFVANDSLFFHDTMVLLEKKPITPNKSQFKAVQLKVSRGVVELIQVESFLT